MSCDSKLTYYDYWLTKQVWNAEHAVNIITNYYVFGRLFDSCDDYEHIKNSFRADLVYKMTHENDVKDTGLLLPVCHGPCLLTSMMSGWRTCFIPSIPVL